jgi:hypothetical protein
MLALSIAPAPDFMSEIGTIGPAEGSLSRACTEFRRQAIDALLDQRLFVLDSERHDAFMHGLENPPLAGPKFRSLPSRVPARRK